jgi:hypothetical protein
MTIGLSVDFSGAVKKTNMLLNLGKASKYQCTSWTAETIRELMRSAADRQISVKIHHAKKTSHMGRNIGKIIAAGEERWSIAIGTGIGGKQHVRYAKYQDEGGTTHPTVTKRMRRWAWFMYSKWGEERYKWLALTKKSRLNVVIPPSGWFTSIIKQREPVLSAMMRKPAVLRVAEMMAGSSAGKLA